MFRKGVDGDTSVVVSGGVKVATVKRQPVVMVSVFGRCAGRRLARWIGYRLPVELGAGRPNHAKWMAEKVWS